MSTRLIVAALLAVMTTATAATTGTMSLERVVFSHRHCARTPTSDTDHLCGDIGCGACTPQGTAMLRELGRTFRAEYGSILPSWYHYQALKSVSDEVPRCIQSANAFVQGLFAFNASYDVFPVVETDGASQMDPWSQPTFKLHEIPSDVETIFNITKVAEKIISVDKIVAIGKEMKLNSLECEALPAVCIAKEIDFLFSARSMGKLSQYPLGEKYLPLLAEVRNTFYRAIEGGYDENIRKDDFFQKAGWPGATLLGAMLDAAKGGPTLTEFSGHDTSLMPLFAAMGFLDTFQYPEFATAVVFEVYSEGPHDDSLSAAGFAPASIRQPLLSDKSSGLHIKAKIGVPGQLPGNHTYAWQPQNLTCLDKNGTTYVATNGVCPYDDLHRYYLTRVPPQGTCYAWPPDLALTFCDPAKYPGPADPKLPCGRYRSSCPWTACGTGRYMTADLACKSI